MDTARLVAWLVSDEADWITSQVIASAGPPSADANRRVGRARLRQNVLE